MLGRGREAELVVDDQVDRAADSVAGDVAHVEALGDDALAGERGVAVHQDRQHRVGARAVDQVLRAPEPCPPTTGSTASRCDGFAASSTLMSAPAGLTNLPDAPRWYLTSPEPCVDVGST